jgi:hypothetical protein
MKKRLVLLSLALFLVVFAGYASAAGPDLQAATQKWKLVNPEGVVVVKPQEIAPRLTTLEGKTILLRWNGKHNGDNFLNRIAELLAKQVPTAKIIKMWEAIPGSNHYPMTEAELEAALKLKPDIQIASQAD